jgi:hypothetical protein
MTAGMRFARLYIMMIYTYPYFVDACRFALDVILHVLYYCMRSILPFIALLYLS